MKPDTKEPKKRPLTPSERRKLPSPFGPDGWNPDPADCFSPEDKVRYGILTREELKELSPEDRERYRREVELKG